MSLEKVSYLSQVLKELNKTDLNFFYLEKQFETYLSRDEIKSILTNNILIEKDSFKVVLNGVYENYESSNDPLNQISRINTAFENKNTVIVKNLETYNHTINYLCQSLGSNTDAHMYLSPEGSIGFPLHQDDRSVVITLLYGSKKFIVEDNNTLHNFILNQGDILFIRQGIYHKAETLTSSCHISYGFSEKLYNEYGYSYPLNINLPF
jgi:ribosomal protein L16 Arg81 hydroxylase